MPTLSITGLPDKAAAVDLEFFIGDDETVEYQPTEDATGWQLRFAVRKTVNAAAALIQLVPIVSGVFPAQTVDIFIADDKTAILKAGAYSWALWRIDGGVTRVLAWGQLRLLQATSSRQ